jgi:hypothetical protein
MAYVPLAHYISRSFAHPPSVDVCLQLIFALSSMLAYLSRTNFAIKQIEKLSWDWIKMDCSGGKCYGLLAVRPFPKELRYLLTSIVPFLGSPFLLCIGRIPPVIVALSYWS